MYIMFFIKGNGEKKTPYIDFEKIEDIKTDEFYDIFHKVMKTMYPKMSEVQESIVFAKIAKFFLTTTNGESVVLYLEDWDLAISTSEVYFYHNVLQPELVAGLIKKAV